MLKLHVAIIVAHEPMLFSSLCTIWSTSSCTHTCIWLSYGRIVKIWETSNQRSIDWVVTFPHRIECRRFKSCVVTLTLLPQVNSNWGSYLWSRGTRYMYVHVLVYIQIQNFTKLPLFLSRKFYNSFQLVYKNSLKILQEKFSIYMYLPHK